MNQGPCRPDRLSQLIQDSLSPSETDELLHHLEGCAFCQDKMDSLAADASWWQRTSRGLTGVALNADGRLPMAAPSPACFVEVLLDAQQPHDSTAGRSQVLATILDPPSHPDMLGRIDEFDIERQIGQGGMGIVFRGFDRSLNRPVAIKVMSPHLGANGVARQRFAREAQAAAAVVHPHVVPIYRVNSSSERPYIAMALVNGCSLQEHVATDGPMAVKDIVRIASQIADGLAAAHRQGLVHRDIKPANILTEKDVSRITITDFGLARAIDDISMTQSGCLAGTPNYMSPEQVTGRTIDHRSDLFSLGGLMFFLATGREPFRADSAFAVINRIVRDVPPSVRRLNAEIPETLDRIIGRLLEKNPSDRIASAAELHGLLTRYLAHLQSPEQHAEPQVIVAPSQRRRVIKRVCWGVSIAACVLAILLGFKSLSLDSSPTELNRSRTHGMRGPDEHTGTGGHDEHHDAESSDEHPAEREAKEHHSRDRDHPEHQSQ